MPLTFPAAVTVALVAGPWLRGLIYAHAVGYRQPLRTDCPQCGTPVVAVAGRGVLAMAPVTGQCRRCGQPIGPVPGSVEALAAAVVAVAAWRAPTPWLLTAWTITGLLGVALASLDRAVLRLPDPLTLAAAASTLTLAAAASIITQHPGILLGALIGATAQGGFYYLAGVRHGMGRGDAMLAFALGAALGWLHLTTVLAGVVWTILTGAIITVILLTTRRIHRRQPLPYGVFLLSGALVAVILS
ncbi:prepilin peptidase [Rugosimonospora africana]|nr:A24 family peptidase [Rugosimonospora africana]